MSVAPDDARAVLGPDVHERFHAALAPAVRAFCEDEWPRPDPEALLRELARRMAIRITLTPVESSNIRAIGYDPGSQTLEVEFRNGSAYRYAGVPAGTWGAFTTAESAGRFFAQSIRDYFECRQIREKTT